MKSKLEKIIEYGFYIFVFLLPWQTRWIYKESFLNNGYWEYGSLSLYVTEIILWIVLISFFVWFLKNQGLRFKSWRQYNIKKLSLMLCVYGLLLTAIITSFFALDFQLAFHSWFRLIEGIALFILILNFDFSKLKISFVLLISAIIQGVFAIWQFLSQATMSSKWFGLASHLPADLGISVVENVTSRWLRAYGSLPHPNMLAGFLVLGLLILISFSFRVKEKNQRIFVLLSFVVLLPSLFFTFSRSAWLALIITVLFLVFYLFFKGDKNLQKTLVKILLINLIIFAVLVINFQDLLLTRLLGTQRLEFQSTNERQIYKGQARQLIFNQPVSGVGIGNYTLAIYEQINPNQKAWDYQPVHSIFPLVFAELGIFGFIFFLMLVLLVISYSLLIGLKDNLSIIYFLSFVAILIISYFDHYFWSLYFGQMLFWIVLGISVKSIKFE